MSFFRLFRRQAALSGAAFCMVLAGCAELPATAGHALENTQAWAGARGFSRVDLPAAPFSLFALSRGRAEIWNVYIEGDGAAWPTPFHPPADPTPDEPVALHLAAQDRAPGVLYLGRPCQYLTSTALAACPARYWLGQRFAPEVLGWYQAWLDQFRAHGGARGFRLIGYSGGGVLAALLAARRSDVVQVLTVAAPLDLAAWVAHHDLSPLTESLDPMRQAAGRLPDAVHFVGDGDRVVPPAIAQGFSARHGGMVRVVRGYDHVCCWSRDWRQLLGELK